MKRIVAAVFAVSVMAGSAQAADLSALSGLYQSKKIKNGNETTTMSLGARYGSDVVDDKSWFADLNYSTTSIKVPAGPKPDPTSGYTVGGGMAWWMKALGGDNFIPYVTLAAHLEGGKTYNGAGNIVDTTGVSYGSDLGLRINTSEKCFVDLSTNLFKSYLTKTEKEKLPAGGTAETTTMDLFADSVGAFGTMTVGIGMKI